jgi:hypothetical protein
MAISDSTYLGLEARGTAGSSTVKSAMNSALLTLAVVLTQYPLPVSDSGESRVELGGTEETLARPFGLQATDFEVLQEMNRVYDELLKNQVELDIKAKRALYSNLWDLYT